MGRGCFAREDFARLAALLEGIEGRFLLSIDDRPEIRELFRWAATCEVDALYTAQGGGRNRRVRELLISGRAPARPVCDALRPALPNWSRADSEKSKQEGARFLDVFGAVCNAR